MGKMWNWGVDNPCHYLFNTNKIGPFDSIIHKRPFGGRASSGPLGKISAPLTP